MRELFGLMNLLDNEKYADEDDFFERFGGDKEAITLPQVQALQVSPAGHSPPPPQPTSTSLSHASVPQFSIDRNLRLVLELQVKHDNKETA